MNAGGAPETAEARNARYTSLAGQIKAMDNVIAAANQTQHDKDVAKANKADLLTRVPPAFMKAYERDQRARGVRGNERGVFLYENDDGMTGLEWGKRLPVMIQRAANTKQEWKDKMEAEGKDESGRKLKRQDESESE